MKKTLIMLIFLFIPLVAFSQDIAKTEATKGVSAEKTAIQELKSHVIDVYGVKKLQFTHLKNGKYISNKDDGSNGKLKDSEKTNYKTLAIVTSAGVVSIVALLFGAMSRGK